MSAETPNAVPIHWDVKASSCFVEDEEEKEDIGTSKVFTMRISKAVGFLGGGSERSLGTPAAVYDVSDRRHTWGVKMWRGSRIVPMFCKMPSEK
eukprot:CAMPEP_0183296610 /NCGR_PEP_ID=MMETSP0160_2-20130417/4087_1 /TAXON_ID=2839 ORGANISM="Odontella Sinensis, Strain Grunow 1884" /NCGR_SAMPLE_ID=MMETSP0160_2 /ASSEMBLY_ACC=CAM_ASM_000250 /LENGTH=93 /DNA_ID=CAMNT_0025458239 /DNA_START=169 /DNA_END=450 /DNA_ORIENTATION=+